MSWSRRVSDELQEHARGRLQGLTGPGLAAGASPAPGNEALDEVPTPTPGRHAWSGRLPTTVRDGRVAVSRTAAAGLVVLAAAALVLAGSYFWRSRAIEAVLPATPVAGASSTHPSPSSLAPSTAESPTPLPSPVGEVVVDVAGKVRRPGVVRLPLGSRVVDAIAAAGGVRGSVDLTALNLARVLADGEQVVVGAEGPPALGGPAGPVAPGGAAQQDGVVNLNTATLEQLDTLPGVGPVLAQRILDWRTAHGRFSTIDELREVSGIGDSRFADLAPRVGV